MSRKVKGLDKKLYFNAGRNLNLILQKEILIEPEITNNLKKLIKDVFIVSDICANNGYYTILFSQLAVKGKVIAFEPDKLNFRYLIKNKELNNLSNVILVQKGISSKSGVSTFYRDITTARTSSLEKNAWHPNATKIKKDIIFITTLDEVSNTYGPPDLIKCDVEGHEVEVLKGAEKVLSNEPILIIEVKDTNRKEVTILLTNYNYIFYNAELPFEESILPSLQIEYPNVLCINKKYFSNIL